jgi:hypothetical protein
MGFTSTAAGMEFTSTSIGISPKRTLLPIPKTHTTAWACASSESPKSPES